MELPVGMQADGRNNQTLLPVIQHSLILRLHLQLDGLTHDSTPGCTLLQICRTARAKATKPPGLCIACEAENNIGWEISWTVLARHDVSIM
jgi:hypothetical protein